MKITLTSALLLATPLLPAAEPVRPSLILVRGADGSPEYAARFDSQVQSWQKAAAKAGAEVLLPRLPVATETPAPVGETDRGRLEKMLTDLPRTGPAPVWIVLIGHGTWDGKEARFNLEGPDLSAGDLAEWLQPVQRPLVIINTASSSAPFLPVLAGPNRTIITATRSGNERNYARFGESLASSLDDVAADYDQDGRTSVLEWVARANNRTMEFYLAEGRIQTEHAMIDDNGDGKGTPLAWFRGLRATTKSKDGTPLDGALSHQRSLAPETASETMTAAQMIRRDQLEAAINALREKKSALPDEEYYRQLEVIFRQLAALNAGMTPP